MLLPFLSHHANPLTADAAVALGSLGICLGFVEFNRPGRILPGALGLLLLLLACASLLQRGIRLSAAGLFAASMLVFVANAWNRLPTWSLVAATLALMASLRFLVPEQASTTVHTPTAIACGAVLGALAGALTRIACRARRSKALN